MNHALVIGGTGMLANVSLWLAEHGYHVSVIGRNPEKMQRLTIQNLEQLTPVLVDYTNLKEFTEQIHRIQQKNGPIQLVVAWVHSPGQHVISCLTELLSPTQPWRLFQVHGSSSNLQEIKAKTALPSHVLYHQIQLGFKIEYGFSRWLTNEEISGGVIEAIREGKTEHLIGILKPWEKRP